MSKHSKKGSVVKVLLSLRTNVDEDLERFYFQYQTEALPHGESVQSFCLR